MTSIDAHTIRATGFTFVPHLARAVEHISDAIYRAQARQATRRALRGLSDRALDDLGLTRWYVDHGC
ncbi:MAG: DUF1127 domain-containing protein [Maritimibacter sp.]